MLDFVTGAPMPVKFGDKQYLVGALKLLEEGFLTGYLRVNSKRPLVAFREIAEFIPESERRQAAKEAQWNDDNWPPSPSSREGQRVFLGTPEGQRFFLSIMLRKYQAALTDDDITKILGEITEECLLTLFEIAFGEDVTDPEMARARVHERILGLKGLEETIFARLTQENLHASLLGANSSPTSP